VKYPVDLPELVCFFEKLDIFFHALSAATGSVFDRNDEFKPCFRTDRSNFRIVGTQISFNAYINDINEETNSVDDYRYFSLECTVWIREDLFCANLLLYGNRGLKETSIGLKRTPVAELIRISESNWPDLYGKLSSDFQNIVLGRDFIQFLLHDFYSEERYKKFKTEAIFRLKEHSLEHLIQP
jgi:hypothetical protein